MNSPTISVFLPAYNQEDFIGEAIESAIHQDVEDAEIVVGDDCSTDSTWEVIQDYAEQYPNKIVAFRNERNLGITGNCNEVLSRCRGKYIAFHAGDDIFLPGKLKAQLQVFRDNPECVLCYHDVDVFDSDTGETIKYWNHGPWSCPAREGNSQSVAACLIQQGTVFMAALSVMVRRDEIPQAGYDCRVPYASDWLMWIDICTRCNGEVKFIDSVLARYRKHKNSITNHLIGDDTDQYVSLALVESRHPKFRNAIRKARGYNYYREGVQAIREGREREGRFYLVQGALMHIYSYKFIGWWLYSWLRQVLARA